MKLSVVILNYNVRYFLELCLKSVEVAIADLDAEIIVVDNNSSDESCAMIKERFPSVKLIENKDNLGFSKGNNIGVAQATGEYLCILNPDTVVAEDTFIKVLKFADTRKNLGIVGCQLIDGKGKFLPESKRNIPYPKVSLKKMLGNDKAYYANGVDVNSTRRVEILVGAFMIIKSHVYRSVGGFDEDYFMYGEDIDLSYKIIKAGFHNYYFGQTTVIHFKGESTLKDSKYAKRFYGAMQIFYKKHFKQNLVFNALVWLGIRLAFVLRTTKQTEAIRIEQTYVICSKLNKELKGVLGEPLKFFEEFQKEIPQYSKVIYDLNYLKVTSVISDLKSKSNTQNLVFRLLPKNSNFIIGSDSAINRGEVMHF